MNVSKEILKKMYLRIRRIREFEQRAKYLFEQGKVPGHFHLYLGEEAVAGGICGAMNDDDYITSTHRGHGHIIAKGADMKYMMAEIYGKETGYCHGKGGSMHICDPDKGILGANGIVGGGLPISLGAGLSAKYLKNKKVCACFFGDGASNEGTFHEALNLASIWKLPILFVCENNQFAISTPQSYHQNIKDIADRGAAYGIPGIVVDGNDIMAVYEVANEAVKRSRQGHGPTLIECKTWRWLGHFAGDPAKYKNPKDQAAWLKKDPLPRYIDYLESNKIFTKKEIETFDNQVQHELDEAVKFAEESAFPTPESGVQDVYSDIIEEVRIR
ncbi:thiamine pyrophosphate-dependent dehydrogenase E1 component subunit alpha [Megasphaera sueciensis]|uniref:thiamine pyrophosphate-dependent dehydrogenase E1 component subunit alpha n=1 Tax=Megasphaera sueciensis TaxID=349094 RepID=UPI003D003AE5